MLRKTLIVVRFLNFYIDIEVCYAYSIHHSIDVEIGEAHHCPARPAAALGQVSATLDHNVATLLVGVVKQIRLRLPRDQARCGRHFLLLN